MDLPLLRSYGKADRPTPGGFGAPGRVDRIKFWRKKVAAALATIFKRRDRHDRYLKI